MVVKTEVSSDISPKGSAYSGSINTFLQRWWRQFCDSSPKDQVSMVRDWVTTFGIPSLYTLWSKHQFKASSVHLNASSLLFWLGVVLYIVLAAFVYAILYITVSAIFWNGVVKPWVLRNLGFIEDGVPSENKYRNAARKFNLAMIVIGIIALFFYARTVHHLWVVW